MSTDSVQCFLLPHQLLRIAGVDGVTVSPSIKLSTDGLRQNRYFARFPAERADPEDIREVCRRLAMPSVAMHVAEQQFGGWRMAGALGAALLDGRVGYRAYFRSGIEAVDRVYGWSLEWRPGASAWAIKRYLPTRGETPEAARLAAERLLTPRPRSRDQQLVDGWVAMLAEAGPRVQILRVENPTSGRVSLDAAPAKVDQRGAEHADASWQLWCRALGISPEPVDDWRRRAVGGRLENVAIGRGDDDELFVTVYVGPFEEPPPPIAEPSRERVAVAPGPVRQPPVYAIGRLAFDPRGARLLDALETPAGDLRPVSGRRLLEAMARDPVLATAVDWTLELDDSAVFALAPVAGLDTLLVDTLAEQLHASSQRVERISLPGHLVGWQTLSSGRRVPRVRPEPRGLFTWSTAALLGTLPAPVPPGLESFLDRLYDGRQRRGIEARDRLLNFVSTQVSLLAEIFARQHGLGRVLTAVEVTPRLGPSVGERWDLVLRFAPPGPITLRAAIDVRVGIDVSEPLPVIIGAPRSWPVGRPGALTTNRP
ncbi:MAG: hypothetical protein AAGD38_01465 [Acidobacteriota bacterium]